MNGLPQIHDGPAPLNSRGFPGPRFAARCAPWPAAHAEKGGGANTSQTQTTATTDNRVATDGDGNQILHGNTVGGSLTLNTLAADVALAALDTAVDLNRTGADTVIQLAGGALDGFQSLLDSNQRTASQAFGLVSSSAANSAANSAASARQVADSQKEFLRAQTGQDTVVKIIGYGLATLAVGGIALAVATSKKSK